MKQRLIVAFYAVLLLNSGFRIAEFALRAALPDKSFLPNQDIKIFYAQCLGATTSVIVELVLIQTMFKLYLALKLLNGKIEPQQIRKWERVLLVLELIYFVGYLVIAVVFTVDEMQGKSAKAAERYLIGAFVVLTLMYTFTAVILNNAMN